MSRNIRNNQTSDRSGLSDGLGDQYLVIIDITTFTRELEYFSLILLNDSLLFSLSMLIKRLSLITGGIFFHDGVTMVLLPLVLPISYTVIPNE